MQRICWILSLGACLLAQAAAADEPCAGNCPCQSHCACHAAPAYSLAPGCGEARRHCYDNAWDGYCQERAKWDTFWCKVGTGAFYPTTPCAMHNNLGVALETHVRPSAAACASCKNYGATATPMTPTYAPTPAVAAQAGR